MLVPRPRSTLGLCGTWRRRRRPLQAPSSGSWPPAAAAAGRILADGEVSSSAPIGHQGILLPDAGAQPGVRASLAAWIGGEDLQRWHIATPSPMRGLTPRRSLRSARHPPSHRRRKRPRLLWRVRGPSMKAGHKIGNTGTNACNDAGHMRGMAGAILAQGRFGSGRMAGRPPHSLPLAPRLHVHVRKSLGSVQVAAFAGLPLRLALLRRLGVPLRPWPTT